MDCFDCKYTKFLRLEIRNPPVLVCTLTNKPIEIMGGDWCYFYRKEQPFSKSGVGEIIARIRRKRGITQETLAERLGCSRKTIQILESTKYAQNPSSGQAFRVMRELRPTLAEKKELLQAARDHVRRY